jgi:hypothetical protein
VPSASPGTIGRCVATVAMNAYLVRRMRGSMTA